MTDTASPTRGRARELEVLDGSIAAAVAGRGTVVLVEGPPGIGKSRLVADAGHRAEDAGLLVGAATADEFAELAPLNCFLQLLRSSRPPVLQSDLFDGLTDLADQRVSLLERLRDLLETFARSHPLLLSIDDIHWADDLTLLAVRVLARQLSTYPVVWILARRTGSSTPGLERTFSAFADEGATTLSLGLLAAVHIREIADDLDVNVDDATVARLAEQSGGNPFYFTEFLRALERDEATSGLAQPDAGELPEQFRATIARQQQSFPAPVRTFLEIASVFGRQFAVTDVAAVLGKPAAEIAGPVNDAMAAGLIIEDGDNLAFRHDLLRRAIYESLPTSLRYALHRDAANAILATGGTAIDAAPHISRGARPGDAEAISVLRRAAQDVATSSPRAAVELNHRLLELLPPDDPTRAVTSAGLLVLLAWSGRSREALALSDTVLRAPSRDTKSDDVVMLLTASAHAAGIGGNYRRSMELAEHALEFPGLSMQQRLQAEVLAAIGMTSTGQLEAGQRRLAAVVAEATSAGMHHVETDALIVLSHAALRRGDLDRSLALVAQAFDASRSGAGEDRRGQPGLALGPALFCADRFDEARDAVVNGRLDCAKLGVPTQLLFYDELAAWIALARGRLEDAAAIAETGVEDASQLDLDAPTADLLQLLVQVALHRGDLNVARQHLTRFDQLAANAVLHGTGYDTSTARVAFAQGDVAGALDALQPVYADLNNMLMHQNNTVPFVPELIRIAQAGGARDCAEVAAQSAHEMAATNPAVDSVVGTAHHGDGLLHDDADALREAVARYRMSPRPLWVAAGVEDLAAHLAERGEREEAIALHEEAMLLYHDAGAVQDAKRNRARLRDLGVRKRQPASEVRPVTGWEALSSAERDVAHLAADGLTNRAIAERLYVSPHTVTTHLKHVFTKLDVHSRVELARLAPSA